MLKDKIELLIDELEERIAPGGVGGGSAGSKTHNSGHGTSHGSGSHGSK